GVLLGQRQHGGRGRAEDGLPVLVPPRRTAADVVRRLRRRLPRRHVRGDGRRPRPDVLRPLRAAAVPGGDGAGVGRAPGRRPEPAVVAAFESAGPCHTFFHGHSFTAHPLACSIAVANWRLLTGAPNPAPARMEAFWRAALAPLAGSPNVREVRVRGTIAAVEL